MSSPNIPAALSYTAEHEWVSIDGATATVGITDFAAQALDGGLQDGAVVERQAGIGEQFVHREPGHVCSVGTLGERDVARRNQRKVHMRGRPAARIARLAAPAAELLQIGAVHACLFPELASGAGLQIGVQVHIHKTAGQGPETGEWVIFMPRTLHQQYA